MPVTSSTNTMTTQAVADEAVELGHPAAAAPRWLVGLFARTAPEAYWASLCPDLVGEAATVIGRR